MLFEEFKKNKIQHEALRAYFGQVLNELDSNGNDDLSNCTSLLSLEGPGHKRKRGPSSHVYIPYVIFDAHKTLKFSLQTILDGENLPLNEKNKDYLLENWENVLYSRMNEVHNEGKVGIMAVSIDKFKKFMKLIKENYKFPSIKKIVFQRECSETKENLNHNKTLLLLFKNNESNNSNNNNNNSNVTSSNNSFALNSYSMDVEDNLLFLENNFDDTLMTPIGDFLI